MNELTTVPNFPAIDLASAQAAKFQQTNDLNSEQLEKIATEFEGVFISLLVKEMRNTMGGSGFFGSEDTDSFGTMFDLFIGQHLAEARPLGISSLWIQQYDNNARVDSNNSTTDSVTA